ncbi:hypothetical protein CBM2586_A10288 [Cupriavidus phytorum]|uniref:Uncharacterized protein n=1 Tax=Cupriavidus taiwanensis TaxID=164546 RepID=A0A975ZVK6_9BURK|nr:hypothetical protein CBM2586_A10288 [Cupriavidus taiwanensis]
MEQINRVLYASCPNPTTEFFGNEGLDIILGDTSKTAIAKNTYCLPKRPLDFEAIFFPLELSARLGKYCQNRSQPMLLT